MPIRDGDECVEMKVELGRLTFLRATCGHAPGIPRLREAATGNGDEAAKRRIVGQETRDRNLENVICLWITGTRLVNASRVVMS